MGTWRRAFAFHPKGHKPAAWPVFFCLNELFATNEFSLLQIDKKTKAGLDWVVLGRKIRAIQRITHFQAKSVASTQAARSNSKGASLFEHLVPHQPCVVGREKNFYAVFPGITGACNQKFISVPNQFR